ncbi:MAG TPA: helicase C-terminal domain-containing protein [Micromonosporaceae bacterium]
MTSTLPQWLAGRTQTELADIIERRPDVLVPEAPDDLDDLADRLHYPQSIRSVLYDMPQPCLELLETLLVFGSGGMTRDELATALGRETDDRELEIVLDLCAMWALAWEVDGSIRIPGALRSLMPLPLRLGPPVDDLLSPRAVDDLRVRAQALGVVPPNRKVALLAAIEEWYADGDAIRTVVAEAPDAQRTMLENAAWVDPVVRSGDAYYYPGRPDPTLSWLLDRGLLITDWQHVLMPREIALAIRGAAWHPTLTATPPQVAGPVIAVETVDRDAAAAANTAIEQFGAVIEACGVTPLAILKSGGVGVREIRRLAKVTAIPEPETRLWLEIAYAGDLIDVDADDIVPTGAFDDWLAKPPAERLIQLIGVWQDLRTVALLEKRPDGVVAAAALAPDSYGSIASELRGDILLTATMLPPGTTVSAPVATTLRDAVVWRRPMITRMLTEAEPAIEALWAEASRFGLVGRDAISSLGRALREGRLAEMAADFAQPPTREAIFQADLTVVVPGTPAASLARLLDTVADRESRGAAGTWRCTPESVRRAFDAGHAAEDLIESLRRVSVGGTLPQPLEYLIADVARRHGTLRVRPVGCILRADDPALLTEIASTRSLGALQLSILAPTVLASALPLDQTLRALREAGFAPVGETVDGVAQVEDRAPRRTANRAPVVPLHSVVVRQSRGEDEDEPPADRMELAAALLAPAAAPAVERHLSAVPEQQYAGVPELPELPDANVRIPTLRVVQRSAVRLNRDQQFVLAQAIDNEREIRIEYVSNDGRTTSRIIQPMELEGSRVIAWCHLRDDERAFSLGGITNVQPA